MIRLVPQTYPTLKTLNENAESFDVRRREPVCRFKMFADGKLCGTADTFLRTSGEARIDYLISPSCRQQEILNSCVNVMINRIIKDYHPQKIVSFAEDSMLRKAFSYCMMYQKGRFYQRIVEPYRYLVDDNCFDEEGYLIHQGKMHGIPFGWFSTKDKGCGWIAAYNLLKMNGMEKTMYETAHGLGDKSLTGEMFGENIFLLYRWLRRQGLDVHYALGKRSCIRHMKYSNNGILLYSMKKNAHYTAYDVRPDGSLHFFNAVYGRQRHYMNPEEFLKKYSFWPNTMLLYVEN